MYVKITRFIWPIFEYYQGGKILSNNAKKTTFYITAIILIFLVTLKLKQFKSLISLSFKTSQTVSRQGQS